MHQIPGLESQTGDSDGGSGLELNGKSDVTSPLMTDTCETELISDGFDSPGVYQTTPNPKPNTPQTFQRILRGSHQKKSTTTLLNPEIQCVLVRTHLKLLAKSRGVLQRVMDT